MIYYFLAALAVLSGWVLGYREGIKAGYLYAYFEMRQMITGGLNARKAQSSGE